VKDNFLKNKREGEKEGGGERERERTFYRFAVGNI